jgi:hypothetical protein
MGQLVALCARLDAAIAANPGMPLNELRATFEHLGAPDPAFAAEPDPAKLAATGVPAWHPTAQKGDSG